MAANPLRVFVYGTLLAGEENHHLLARSRLIAEARTTPAFELRDLGAFPALVAGGRHAVTGELYEIDEPTLAALDHLEDHPRYYQRAQIVLESGDTAWTYLLGREQVEQCAVIESGSWRAHQRAVLRHT